LANIFSTAADSIQIEDIEQIDASDLTVSNLKRFFESLLPGIRSLAFDIIVCIIIYIVGRKLIKLLHKMLNKTLEKTQADVGVVKFLGSALEIILYVFLFFMILGQLGVNTASIITVLGTAMLAVGMSLQGSLSNVAGGILILFTKPFRVGHYIISDHGEGTVTMIGLFYTTITTKDNRILTLPNSQISNCAVTNCSQNPVRRFDTVVGISYDSDIRLAKKIMEETARDCQYVLQDQDITVFVDGLGDSSVDIGMFCYVNSPDFLAAKWQITEEIKLRFDEAGISIPFPQVHVHMEKE
jgi:small conductance mechanosensitive channel